MIANMAAIEALDSAIKDRDIGGLGTQEAVPVSGSQPSTPQNRPAGQTQSVAQELELIFQREKRICVS